MRFLKAYLETRRAETAGFCGKWQIRQSSSARAARVSVAGDAAALSCAASGMKITWFGMEVPGAIKVTYLVVLLCPGVFIFL